MRRQISRSGGLPYTDKHIDKDHAFRRGLFSLSATSGHLRVVCYVYITASPKTTGIALQYRFTVNTWFVLRANDGVSLATATTYCSGLGGVIPNTTQLTSGTGVRGVGSMWGEWSTLTSARIYSSGYDIWYKTLPNEMVMVNGSSGGRVSGLGINMSVGTACAITL